MSSLQGDLNNAQTEEPREISSNPTERVVEAETLDYRFTQQDLILDFGRGELSYGRTAERFNKHAGGSAPEAKIEDTIRIKDGKETGRTIICHAKWDGVTASSVFSEIRQEASREGGTEAEASDRTTIGYTVDLSQENEYLVVDTNQVRTVINPENENGRPPRRTERRETHTITRSVSDFAPQGGNDSIWGSSNPGQIDVASGRIYQIEIANDRVTVQSTDEIPEVIARGSDGEYFRYSSLVHDTKFTSTTEMSLAEFREKSGLSLYVAEAELKVQNQPRSELILNPEKGYLIPGGLSTKPSEPLKDFVAKEVLRAI